MKTNELGKSRSFGEFLFGVSDKKLTLKNQAFEFVSLDNKTESIDPKASSNTKIKTLKNIAKTAYNNLEKFKADREDTQDFAKLADKSISYIDEIYYSRALPVRLFLRILGIMNTKALFAKINKLLITTLTPPVEKQKETLKETPEPVVARRVSIPESKCTDTTTTKRVYDEKAFKIDLDTSDDPSPSDIEEDSDKEAEVLQKNLHQRLGKRARLKTQSTTTSTVKEKY